ncbi:response regulator transcription factor [Aquimarina sp. 2-A2]|uniref:response regulator transcription factor n=1 Tax=Aquimarina sp. 2-A2 TaxID=3382644 RepID=UPI00387EEECA
MIHLLLAEDNVDLGGVLKQYLEMNNFNVHWAKNGEDALEIFKKNELSICVLDIMMPILDGFSLAEKMLKMNSDIPFIFLTAKGAKREKMKGLKLGADDYIVKPFEADELVARINNILKRTRPHNAAEKETIKIGNFSFSRSDLILKHIDKTQRLTQKEADLIAFLYHNRHQLIKRGDILSTVWGNDDFFSGRSMDVFISRLRGYFRKDSNISIKSIRGIGFEFNIKNKNK